MARSRRKTPIIGNAGHSEKRDKRIANRRLRRIVRERLRRPWCELYACIYYVPLNETPEMPLLREISNVWAMAKDGKHWVDGERYAAKWGRLSWRRLLRK